VGGVGEAEDEAHAETLRGLLLLLHAYLDPVEVMCSLAVCCRRMRLECEGASAGVFGFRRLRKGRLTHMLTSPFSRIREPIVPSDTCLFR
jgi:hypothetical protein